MLIAINKHTIPFFFFMHYTLICVVVIASTAVDIRLDGNEEIGEKKEVRPREPTLLSGRLPCSETPWLCQISELNLLFDIETNDITIFYGRSLTIRPIIRCKVYRFGTKF